MGCEKLKISGRGFATGTLAVCLLVTISAAIYWKSADPPVELSTEVYVWQRTDTPELRAALARSDEVVSRRHFLGVEIGRHGGGWRVSRSTVPDELLAGQ